MKNQVISNVTGTAAQQQEEDPTQLGLPNDPTHQTPLQQAKFNLRNDPIKMQWRSNCLGISPSHEIPIEIKRTRKAPVIWCCDF
ncbi:hypothetical protein V6N13_059735 [Hibiscus sabdariffa]